VPRNRSSEGNCESVQVENINTVTSGNLFNSLSAGPLNRGALGHGLAGLCLNPAFTAKTQQAAPYN
jgi:hypothetical protein